MVRGYLSNLRNLFFIKRLPKLHVPSDYKKPEDETEFKKKVDQEGFVSPESWKKDDLLSYETIAQDLNDLEEHLLPAFFEFDQKAKHYQNRFYLYQWVFMGGSFITTFLGALTTYFYTLDVDGSLWTQVSGILTAVVSGLTASVSVLSNQGSPQKHWAKTRRLAEDLRMTYYTYLAHLAPYDGPNRVQKLRQHIITIRRKENENG